VEKKVGQQISAGGTLIHYCATDQGPSPLRPCTKPLILLMLPILTLAIKWKLLSIVSEAIHPPLLTALFIFKHSVSAVMQVQRLNG
jgi:hypothetical protein